MAKIAKKLECSEHYCEICDQELFESKATTAEMVVVSILGLAMAVFMVKAGDWLVAQAETRPLCGIEHTEYGIDIKTGKDAYKKLFINCNDFQNQYGE